MAWLQGMPLPEDDSERTAVIARCGMRHGAGAGAEAKGTTRDDHNGFHPVSLSFLERKASQAKAKRQPLPRQIPRVEHGIEKTRSHGGIQPILSGRRLRRVSRPA